MLPDYDCITCTENQKKERGCEVEIEGPMVLSIDGEEQRRCPRRPILEDPGLYGEIFWLHRYNGRGQLPETGGLENQPNKLMQCFRIIEIATGQVERFNEEQDARKRRRAARASPGRRRAS